MCLFTPQVSGQASSQHSVSQSQSPDRGRESPEIGRAEPGRASVVKIPLVAWLHGCMLILALAIVAAAGLLI